MISQKYVNFRYEREIIGLKARVTELEETVEKLSFQVRVLQEKQK